MYHTNGALFLWIFLNLFFKASYLRNYLSTQYFLHLSFRYRTTLPPKKTHIFTSCIMPGTYPLLTLSQDLIDETLLEGKINSTQSRNAKKILITETLLTCEYCQFSSTIKQKLQMYRVLHLEKRFKCSECKFASYFKTKLRSHVKEVHLKQPRTSEADGTCDECDFKTTRKERLKLRLNDHIRRVHEGVVYPCHLCSHIATYKQNLTEHLKIKHFGGRNKPRPKIKCEEEGCSFEATKHELNLHIKIKHEGFIFGKCSFTNCSFSSATKKGLDKHSKVCRQIHACNFCEKKVVKSWWFENACQNSHHNTN